MTVKVGRLTRVAIKIQNGRHRSEALRGAVLSLRWSSPMERNSAQAFVTASSFPYSLSAKILDLFEVH